MANNKMKTRVAYTLILLLAGTVTGLMAAPDPSILAEIENEGTALVFYPVTEFSELILTVTGPCDFQYRQVIMDDWCLGQTVPAELIF